MSSPLPIEELRAQVRLQLVPGLGPERTRALLDHFESACRILHVGAEELATVDGISENLANKIVRALRQVDLEAELDRMERHQVSAVLRGRPGYPAPLAEVSDAPTLLYFRGTIIDADSRAVAIVGSRGCTDYGRRVAKRLASGLATAGYTIVSGLARGIDGEAHRGALEAGGRTLAVLAGGLSKIYPPEHLDLSREVSRAGAVLSESSMDQPSLPGLFHSRNRIISGLSRAVVVVEAAARSGTLITARHAADQGRTVLAIPGSIESDASAGTNELIRTGAVLCRGIDDILEELDGVSAMFQRAASTQKSAPSPVAEKGQPPGLDANQSRIWDLLSGGSRSVDELAQELGLAISTLSGALMMMEMKKAIRRLPGNRYERT